MAGADSRESLIQSALAVGVIGQTGESSMFQCTFKAASVQAGAADPRRQNGLKRGVEKPKTPHVMCQLGFYTLL